MLDRVRAVAHRAGIEIGRFPPQYLDRRRGRLLRSVGVELVIDVGANQGQFGYMLRNVGGYSGRIVSFEPASGAFDRLQDTVAEDPLWEVRQLALMNSEGELTLNIAAGDDLNSFRSGSQIGGANLPIETVAQETVPTARLDTLYDELAGDAVTFLKIDVQGAESEVLAGAHATLPRLVGLMVELPFVPVYEGTQSAADTIALLDEAGFRLVGADPLFFDEELGLNLEFDAVFLRRDVLEALVQKRLDADSIPRV